MSDIKLIDKIKTSNELVDVCEIEKRERIVFQCFEQIKRFFNFIKMYSTFYKDYKKIVDELEEEFIHPNLYDDVCKSTSRIKLNKELFDFVYGCDKYKLSYNFKKLLLSVEDKYKKEASMIVEMVEKNAGPDYEYPYHFDLFSQDFVSDELENSFSFIAAEFENSDIECKTIVYHDNTISKRRFNNSVGKKYDFVENRILVFKHNDKLYHRLKYQNKINKIRDNIIYMFPY